jgi:hypothetical protein
MDKSTARFTLTKQELKGAMIISLFFFLGTLAHTITIAFGWENTWFDSRRELGYLRFTHLLIFLISIIYSFQVSGWSLKYYSGGVSWARDQNIPENGTKSFIFLVLALIYNPFYIFEIPSLIWLLFHIGLVYFFAKEVLSLQRKLREEKMSIQKNKEEEKQLIRLIEKVDIVGIDDFFIEREHQIDFDELLRMLVKYKSIGYLKENQDSLIKQWEHVLNWKRYPPKKGYETLCRNVLESICNEPKIEK